MDPTKKAELEKQRAKDAAAAKELKKKAKAEALATK